MNKRYILPLVILALVIGASLWIIRLPNPRIEIFDSQAAIRQEEANDRSVPADEYVKRNLAGLSTEAGFPAVEGGIFEVSQISAQNGKGSVTYSDGKNTYTANFTYEKDKKGLITIKNFSVAK